MSVKANLDGARSSFALPLTPSGKQLIPCATLSLDSFTDLSDFFGNRIAVLHAATGSRKNTYSDPDTDSNSKTQDVTQCVILAANFSSQ